MREYLSQKLASTFLPFSGLVGRKLSHSEPFLEVSFLKPKSCEERKGRGFATILRSGFLPILPLIILSLVHSSVFCFRVVFR